MRTVVQRVRGASVEVGGAVIGRIDAGLVALVGVAAGDEEADVSWTAEKLVHLRVFEDESGKMNRSVLEVAGGVLLVPNFTVAGDCRRGRRPSFDTAMRPDAARVMFDEVVRRSRELGASCETGAFGADMLVRIENAGPVTLVLDSREARG